MIEGIPAEDGEKKQMKYWVILALCLGLISVGHVQSIQAQSIKANVSKSKSWSIDTARAEAFLEAPKVLDLSEYTAIDPHLIENKEARINKQDIRSERIFTKFDNGDYSVTRLCSKRSFYYRPNGQLVLVEDESVPSYYDSTCRGEFPKKSFKYTYPTGRLVGVSIDVNSFESFVFAPDGSLAFHWLGNRCYDGNGARCGNRKSYRKLPPNKEIKRLKS